MVPPVPADLDVLWMHVARSLIGLREKPGPEADPQILAFFEATSLRTLSDETAWCAAFVGWCLRAAGVRPTGRANARSYLQWGSALEAPRYGCVTILKRGHNPRYGHVGFFVRLEGPHVVLLGGNQGNRVCERAYPAAHVLGYRWPSERVGGSTLSLPPVEI